MKIYAVTTGDYSEYHICEVFTDKKKAELYCAVREEKEFLDNREIVFGDEYMIEEFDTHDDNIEGTVHYGVRAIIYEGIDDDQFNDYRAFIFASPITDGIIEAKRLCRMGCNRRNCKIYTYAIDESTYNELKNDTFAARDYIKERMKNDQENM